jgi:hypothetical protein
MTIGEVAQVIGACASLVAALSSLRNGKRAKITAATVQLTVAKVAEIHEATNGLVEKLGNAKLAQGDAEGHARGIEEGRKE